MKKAPEAFRTISEVSDLLETPAHVLRFWESKFYQIRPVKRAGGRRYYRPDDVALINGIRLLLQDGGLTIRGVQRILQEKGVRHLIDMGADLPEMAEEPGSALTSEVVTASAPPETAKSETAPPETAKSAQNAALTSGMAAAPTGRPPVLPLRPAWPLQIMPGHDESDEIRPTPGKTGARDPAPDMPRPDGPSAPDIAAKDTDDFGADRHEAQPVTAPVAPRRSANQSAPPGLPARTPGKSPVRPAAEVIDDANPEVTAPAPAPAEPRLPHLLRQLPRDLPSPLRDRAGSVARRLDAILDRMSEASGAGRW